MCVNAKSRHMQNMLELGSSDLDDPSDEVQTLMC